MIPPRRPWSGWLDGGHLTLDVVVALVDGELAEGPHQRALAHIDHCLSCAAEVTAQRQARRRLRDARMPGAPTSLLSSLRAIPESADLPPVPGTLAVDVEGRFVVRASDHADDRHGDPHGDAHRDVEDDPPGTTSAPVAAQAPPAGTDSTDMTGRPERAHTGGSRRSRRTRRRLAFGLPAAVASGLAVGAVTLSTPAAAPTPPAATPRPVVVPRGDGARGGGTAAQLSLRGDEGPGLPGPGSR